MDLGLAQLADETEGRLTRTRQFVGTLRYASPEQVLAAGARRPPQRRLQPGRDLWELLTLRPLFGADGGDADAGPDAEIQTTDPTAAEVQPQRAGATWKRSCSSAWKRTRLGATRRPVPNSRPTWAVSSRRAGQRAAAVSWLPDEEVRRPHTDGDGGVQYGGAGDAIGADCRHLRLAVARGGGSEERCGSGTRQETESALLARPYRHSAKHRTRAGPGTASVDRAP